MGTIDSASLIEAFKTMGPVDRPESAPYDFSKPAFPDHPVMSKMRIFGKEHYLAQVQHGVITPIVGDFIDPLATNIQITKPLIS
jgi:hypothetical protein